MATLGKQLKGSAAAQAKEAALGKSGAVKAGNAVARSKAAEEAELARRLADQSKKMLLDRFKAEEQASRAHRAEVEASWMRILRMAKVESLRQDVETLAAQHERDCAHRDATLRMMFDDLMAAEEQYRVALHNHMQQVDDLIALQDTRITDLEGTFEDQLQALTNEFKQEMDHIQQQHVIERRELRSLIATITEVEETKAADAKHEHETAREEIRNRSIDRIQELSRLLDDRIMELEGAFEAEHINYLHATDAKTEAFKSLVAESTRAERRIARRAEAVERARAALTSLRNKMAGNAREFEDKNAALTREKVEQSAHVAALKSKLDAFRAQSDARLQKLSVNVRAARSKVEANLGLASRILQIAERCRQLESKSEQVTPVPIADVAAMPGAADGQGGGTELGADATVVVAGPAAAVRVTTANLAATLSNRDGVAAAGDAGAAPSPSDAEAEAAAIAAATATLTAGGIIPPELTAARHGMLPRADGRLPTAQAAQLSQTIALRAEAAAAGLTTTTEGGANAALAAAANADLDAAAALESALMRETIASGELDALDLFWRRYNRALLDKLVTERRRAELADENGRLQTLLAQCLGSLGVTDATLRAPEGNPLLVVNGRAGLAPGALTAGTGRHGPGLAVPTTAIDGPAVLATYAAHAMPAR